MDVVVADVSFRYPALQRGAPADRPVLTSCHLAVPSGTSVAVVGPSGCGKSTLLHLLAGLLRPDTGTITWDKAHRCPALGHRIALLPQDHMVDERLSARDNIALPGCFRNNAIANADIDQLLSAVGLAAYAQQPAGCLSGGQRLRVALARSLAMAPGLLLADEPTAALDAETARPCGALLIELCKQRGTTCMIATHDPELAALCDAQFDLTLPTPVASGPVP